MSVACTKLCFVDGVDGPVFVDVPEGVRHRGPCFDRFLFVDGSTPEYAGFDGRGNNSQSQYHRSNMKTFTPNRYRPLLPQVVDLASTSAPRAPTRL